MKKWSEIVKKYPEANFLQSPSCGEMNEELGDKVITEDIPGATGNFGRALLIVRNARRGRYIEIPCGPLIDWTDKKMVEAAFAKITEVAKEEKCVFVRIRPQIKATPENLKLMEKLGLRRAPMHLAAEHTVMIDLKLSEEELLANMRRQTRYEVRRAEKQGIVVTISRTEDIFREFHKVQAETAKRQNFVPPSLNTLLAERKAFGEEIAIYKAETADGEPIAYGLIIRDGREGDYYEAASTELNRKMPGAYAVLWRAMRELKSAGYERFNLWGIAPPGQTNHRYAGVTTFKTGFGGEIIEYVPAHDLVISRVKYLKDLVVEETRKKKRHL